MSSRQLRVDASVLRIPLSSSRPMLTVHMPDPRLVTDIHRINRATNQPQTLAHFRNNRSLWFPFPWVLSARPHHIGSDLLLLHRTLYFEHTLVARRTLGAYVDMKMLRLPSPTPNSLFWCWDGRVERNGELRLWDPMGLDVIILWYIKHYALPSDRVRVQHGHLT